MKSEEHFPMGKSPIYSRVHPTSLANEELQEGLVCGTWLGFLKERGWVVSGSCSNGELVCFSP